MEKQYSKEEHSPNKSVFRSCRLQEFRNYSAQLDHGSIAPSTGVLKSMQISGC